MLAGRFFTISGEFDEPLEFHEHQPLLVFSWAGVQNSSSPWNSSREPE